MTSLLYVQLVTLLLVYLLALSASSVLRVPTKGHRERRQTLDFSSNTGDNDTITSLSDANGIDEFELSDSNDMKWGKANSIQPMIDRAVLNGNGGSLSHSDTEVGEGNLMEQCEVDCYNTCLIFGQCENILQCANYSCPMASSGGQVETIDPLWQPWHGKDERKRNRKCRGCQKEPHGCCQEPSQNPPENVSELLPPDVHQCQFHSWTCMHGNCTDGYTCVCEKGWIGGQCESPCTLDCGEHGECTLKSKTKPPSEITENDMFCSCERKYYGDKCEDIRPDRVAEAKLEGRKVALILGCCLVVAIVISAILPIVLWRRRVIFVMRMVYFFKMWEDNDGKLYDAYISAGTTQYETRFVNRLLAPRLQSKGFKLYIPSRDQLCGDLLSEDILTAINQSRRTIMVVTPDYLKNEWSRFEALNAQVETIKLKQRIIPIILEDVSQEKPHMQKFLRHILDSVKCLKVPQSDSTKEQSSISAKKMTTFWRRLELIMPKTKTAVNSNTEYDVGNKLSEQSDSNKIDHLNASVDQKDNFAEVDLSDIGMENNKIIVDLKISPLSLYENNSINYQEIDPSKYEQCFSIKNDL